MREPWEYEEDRYLQEVYGADESDDSEEEPRESDSEL